MKYCVYILYSVRIDSYYVGSTGNLQDRFNRHNGGRSKYTKRGIPWILVYKRAFATRSDAYNAEMYIKKQKSRIYIEELIQTQLVQSTPI